MVVRINEVLYLDFDNTLANSSKRICEMYNEDFKDHPDFVKANWELVRLWDFKDQCPLITRDEVIQYFNEERFFDGLELYDGAKEAVERLSNYYFIIIPSMGWTKNLALKGKFIKETLNDVLYIPINFDDTDDKRGIDMSNGVHVDDNSKMLNSSNAKLKITFGEVCEWNSDWTGLRFKCWKALEFYLKTRYYRQNFKQEKWLMNKKVYIAGDMLQKGSQMLRAKERDDIGSLGFDFYNPMDNKEINDKANADNDGLAERIVKADTNGIKASDIVVIEIQPQALGTITELGQIKGMKDVANDIFTIISTATDSEEALIGISNLVRKIRNQKVYAHCEDVRRFPNAGQDEIGDRRSFSNNAYVYGVCLDLTNGVGFYEWDEILDELKKIKEDDINAKN